MKLWKYIPILFLSLLAFGQTTPYSQFHILIERNIFNPNRGTTNTVHSTTTNYDAFTLVGIMQYEKGTFAFFDGTNSIYQKSLKVNDQLAHYTVSALTADTVTLVSSNETLRVKVGMALTNSLSGKIQSLP